MSKKLLTLYVICSIAYTVIGNEGDPPCGPPAYIYPNGSCSTTECDSEHFDTKGSEYQDVSYCEPKETYCWVVPGTNYFFITNCSNPDHGCPHSNFLLENGDCTEYCDLPKTARRDGMSAYCDENQCYMSQIYDFRVISCPNSGSNCTSTEFIFQDGHCDFHCDPLFTARLEGGLYAYCDNPYSCGSPSYGYPNGSCSTTSCDPKKYSSQDYSVHGYSFTICTEWPTDCWVRKMDDNSPTSETNCTNPDHACPESHFLFQDGSCHRYCNEPYFARQEGNSSYCDSPCPPGFYHYSNGTCSEWPTDCWVQKVDGDNSASETNCTNPDTGCPESSFLFYSGRCERYCPEGFVPRQRGNSSYCHGPCSDTTYHDSNGDCIETSIYLLNSTYYDSPCPAGLFPSANGTCVDTSFFLQNSPNYSSPCGPGLYQYVNGSCIETSVNLQIYLRYNIPFIDFHKKNGSSEFLSKLASAMEVESSTVQILSIREGSTIIEARVPVPLQQNSNENSLDTALMKAEIMKNKLSTAVTNKELVILETGSVLNFEQSVQVSTSNQENAGVVIVPEEESSKDLEASDSSALTVGLSAGLAVLVVLVIISGFVIYRKKKARQVTKMVQPQKTIIKNNECKDNNIQGNHELQNSSFLALQRNYETEPEKHVPITPEHGKVGPKNNQAKLDCSEISIGIPN